MYAAIKCSTTILYRREGEESQERGEGEEVEGRA
jgi:hypothetical protein